MTRPHSDTIDRSTRTRPTSTQWQKQRASGPLLPLEQPKGWLARIVGR